MTRRTIPLTVPGVTEAEVAVGALVVGVETTPPGLEDGHWADAPLYHLVIEEPEPQGQTERRRWHVRYAAIPTAGWQLLETVFYGQYHYGVYEERP